MVNTQLMNSRTRLPTLSHISYSRIYKYSGAYEKMSIADSPLGEHSWPFTLLVIREIERSSEYVKVRIYYKPYLCTIPPSITVWKM